MCGVCLCAAPLCGVGVTHRLELVRPSPMPRLYDPPLPFTLAPQFLDCQQGMMIGGGRDNVVVGNQ